MPDIEDFKLFLDRHRKKNGETLLESTKERYMDWIKRFKTEIDEAEDKVAVMNSRMKLGNIVMYAAFKAYLTFMNYPREKVIYLERPQVLPTAFSSIRKLQSQVLSRAELKILMDNIKDPQLRLAMSILYDTAARRAELMKIKFAHIEPVKDPQDNIYAKVRILGKGHKSREVYLGKLSFEMLKEHAKGKKKQDYVIRFYKDNKEYKSQEHQLWRELKKQCETLLGRNVHPHSFRHCFSEDTEVLTEFGWERYNEISLGTKIFTLNMNTDEIEAIPVEAVNVYDAYEELVHIKTRHIDSLVTKDHKNVMRILRNKQETVAKVKKRWDIWGKWELLSYEKLKERKGIRIMNVRTSGFKKEGKSIGLTKASILGWVLSDGSIDKKYKFFTISQSPTANPEKVEIIRNLLKESGMKFSEYNFHYTNSFTGKPTKSITFRIPNYECKWIFDYINIDRTPKWNLLELKGDELNAIYTNMMLGDGTRHKEYTGQNIKRIEFIRILCTLTNRRSTLAVGKHNKTGLDKHRTYTSNGNSEQILEKHIKIVPYKGIVWCPSTRNGTVICRRNGCIFITGNTSLTHLADNGAPVEDISKYAGHSSLSTTMIYIHNSTFMGERAFKNYSKNII